MNLRRLSQYCPMFAERLGEEDPRGWPPVGSSARRWMGCVNRLFAPCALRHFRDRSVGVGWTPRVQLLRSAFSSRSRTGSVIMAHPMPGLILELATDHGNHYEVLDEARNVVGHIMLSDAAPPEMPWISNSFPVITPAGSRPMAMRPPLRRPWRLLPRSGIANDGASRGPLRRHR